MGILKILILLCIFKNIISLTPNEKLALQILDSELNLGLNDEFCTNDEIYQCIGDKVLSLNIKDKIGNAIAICGLENLGVLEITNSDLILPDFPCLNNLIILRIIDHQSESINLKFFNKSNIRYLHINSYDGNVDLNNINEYKLLDSLYFVNVSAELDLDLISEMDYIQILNIDDSKNIIGDIESIMNKIKILSAQNLGLKGQVLYNENISSLSISGNCFTICPPTNVFNFEYCTIDRYIVENCNITTNCDIIESDINICMVTNNEDILCDDSECMVENDIIISKKINVSIPIVFNEDLIISINITNRDEVIVNAPELRFNNNTLFINLMDYLIQDIINDNLKDVTIKVIDGNLVGNIKNQTININYINDCYLYDSSIHKEKNGLYVILTIDERCNSKLPVWSIIIIVIGILIVIITILLLIVYNNKKIKNWIFPFEKRKQNNENV